MTNQSMTNKRRRSPRERRLSSDFRAISELAADSSILEFAAAGSIPEQYTVVFHGSGLFRNPADDSILVRDRHEVSITLTSAYPRMIPELAWQTPIFHPNISASGVVCLGGYGTHWVPSLKLDELCNMLWDMIRYRNFDIESPYNREAAVWAKQQDQFRFPLDERQLRDRQRPREIDSNRQNPLTQHAGSGGSLNSGSSNAAPNNAAPMNATADGRIHPVGPVPSHLPNSARSSGSSTNATPEDYGVQFLDETPGGERDRAAESDGSADILFID